MFKIIRFISLLTLTSLLLSCVLEPSPYLPVAPTEHKVDLGVHRGAVVLIHGLNTKPERMDALASEIQGWGFDTIRIELAGHSEASRHAATMDNWREDIESGYIEAKAISHGGPIILLGYSVGALVAASFINDEPHSDIKGAIFLAPPFSLRSKVFLLAPLTLFDDFKISIPSFAPKEYRALDSTSLRSYSALFSLYCSLQTVSDESPLLRTKVLVVLSRNDELVDSKGVSKWITRIAPYEWKTVEIDAAPERRDLYQHLVIDEESLGSPNWKKLLSELSKFLSSVTAQ